MTRSLQSAKMKITCSGTVRNVLTSNTSRSSSGTVTFTRDTTIVDGIAANQANRGYEYSATILSGANVVIDLYDLGALDLGSGAGNDILGQEMLLESVVTLIIGNSNAIGVAGSLEIIPDPTDGWTPIGTHTVATGGALRGQGVLLKHQPSLLGFNVTDASNHRIKLTASGGNVAFTLFMFARDDDEYSSSSSSSSSESSSSESSSSKSSSSTSSKSSSSTSSASSSSISSPSSSSVSSSSLSSTSSSSTSSSVSTSSVSSSSEL